MAQILFWVKPETQTEPTTIQIKKCMNPHGSYTELIVIPAKNNGVYVTSYTDGNASGSDWYKVAFKSADGATLAETNPIQGEVTHTSQMELLYRLRAKIGDTQSPYCFSDWELIQTLKDALITHNKKLTWATLPEAEQLLVLWLAIVDICEVLATDSSKFYNLSIEGVSVNKSERVEKYRLIKEDYEKRYKEKANQWGIFKEGFGEIIVGNLTRQSLTTGQSVPHNLSMPPEAVVLHPANKVRAGSCYLSWTEVKDENFYYYAIWRATVPNRQIQAIIETYNRRLGFYSIAEYQSIWNGLTVPVMRLFRDNVTAWTDYNNPSDNFSREYPILPGQTQYYVVSTINKNLMVAVSNEIAVTFTQLAPPIVYDPIFHQYNAIIGEGEPMATVYAERWNTVTSAWDSVGNAYIVPTLANVFNMKLQLVAGQVYRFRQLYLGQYSDYTKQITVV